MDETQAHAQLCTATSAVSKGRGGLIILRKVKHVLNRSHKNKQCSKLSFRQDPPNEDCHCKIICSQRRTQHT